MSEQTFGTFNDEGQYIPRPVVENDLSGQSLEDAYTATMVEVEDGQIVAGVIVKVDRDEVLLDIGSSPKGSFPLGSCRSVTTSTRPRSFPSVTRSKPSSCKGKTKTVA